MQLKCPYLRYFHCIFPYVSSDNFQKSIVMTMSNSTITGLGVQQRAKVCMDVPHGLTEGVRGSVTLISVNLIRDYFVWSDYASKPVGETHKRQQPLVYVSPNSRGEMGSEKEKKTQCDGVHERERATQCQRYQKAVKMHPNTLHPQQEWQFKNNFLFFHKGLAVFIRFCIHRGDGSQRIQLWRPCF